jgi:cytidylate kinase
MTKDYVLSPSDEARLAAWHRQAQAHISKGLVDGPCITISREFGCQAHPLARELSTRLGDPWAVLDREILQEVAKKSGFSLEQIEKSRDTPAVLKAIFAMFLDQSHAEETKIFEHLHHIVCKFAAAGRCIIVGSGGVYAARDMKNAFHVRLVAPLEYRVDTIARKHRLTIAQATEHVQLHQKQRDDFIHRLAGKSLESPLNYHLVLNNGLLSPPQMAAIIEAGIRQRGMI